MLCTISCACIFRDMTLYCTCSCALFRIAGYDENKCEQPWTVPLSLKLLVSVPSVVFILLSLIFLHFYPINEASRERTKRLLQERRFDCYFVVNYTLQCVQIIILAIVNNI